jgi:Zn-dependent protease with chaperone function
MRALLLLLVSVSCLASEKGVAIRDTDLLSTADTDSVATAHLKEGSKLGIGSREGAWYHAVSDDGSGYVPMLAVKLTSAEGIEPRPAAKFAWRTRTAVMGVRGLDEVDLKAAKPDEKAVDELEKFAATPAELAQFARFGKTKLVVTPAATPSPLASPSAPLTPEDEAEEARTGRAIAAQLLGGAPLVNAPEIQHYINRVGSWLAARSDRPALKWRFGVVASDSINAFAVPGGYVFVTMALYQRLGSESELAGVLGHEITHVVNRDHYRILMVDRAMAKMRDGFKNIKAGGLDVVKTVGSSVADRGALVFTAALDKGTEANADKAGMRLAADAGYEPYGLPRVLQLLALEHPDDPAVSLLFKTHPSPAERLKAVEPALGERALASKAAAPDLHARFEEFDLRGLKLKRE